MRRRVPGPVDLEALNPLTGEPLAEDLADPGRGRQASPRVRLLRHLTVILVALSLAAAITAAYSGATVASLRDIERTWREAVAIDEARAEADQFVLDTLREFGDPTDDETGGPIARIGDEEAARLEELEEDVRNQVVANGGVRRLRDSMLETLQFRRFQLQPARVQLDNSRLLRVEAELDAQLRRWRLDPRPHPEPPRLAAADKARKQLARFADGTTRSTAVVTSGRRLLAIEIDRSKVTEIAILDRSITGLVVKDGTAVVVTEQGSAIGFALPAGPKLWELPAITVVPAAEPDALWLESDGSVARVTTSGEVNVPPVRLPQGRRLVAAVERGLVLASAGDEFGEGLERLEVWHPESRTIVTPITAYGRLVAASNEFVAWQNDPVELWIKSLSADTPTGLDLPRTDAGAGAFSPNDRWVLAFAAGPKTGDRAVIVRYSPGRGLIGLRGPSTIFTEAPAWSASGGHLFWVTRDGRLGILEANESRASVLRVDLDGIQHLGVTADR